MPRCMSAFIVSPAEPRLSISLLLEGLLAMAHSLLYEFFAGLFKIIWISLTSFVKLFLPVPKKNVNKETVLVTGAASGIGRLIAIR